MPTHVDHLTWFTAESFGGPDRNSRAETEDELNPLREVPRWQWPSERG